MKDAKGHGSNPRGGAAAHQAGVEKIGLGERIMGKLLAGHWEKQEQNYAVKPWSAASQAEAGQRLAALKQQQAWDQKRSGLVGKLVYRPMDYINKK